MSSAFQDGHHIMALNWIDLSLGALLFLGIFLGWRRGFLLEFFGLATWIAGLLLGLRFYQPLAQWLTRQTDWSATWTKPIGFLVIFFLILFVLRLAPGKLIAQIPPKIHQHLANKLLGIVPGFANGLIYAIVAATLLMALPLPEPVQNQARESALNNRFASYAEVAEAALRPVFDDAISTTFNTLTVRPQSKEMVKLPFTMQNSKPLPALEARMLELVNQERTAAGLQPLVRDTELTRVARKHSADMLARGYFSHYSPEGKSAFDRLRADKIFFLVAGENLAFAPTVKLAHTGLMNSPGHRANILRPQFGKVGIGIMDAGPRGIMVTQKFSN